MDTISVWRAAAREEKTTFPVLEEDISTDVVIVGGGITGVTLALNLAELGISAVLLEAHDVGFGSTGNSTGNLYETVSNGMHGIVERWDSGTARAVAAARRDAVEQIERRVRQFNIPCGFRRCPLYRYATSEQGRNSMENEYKSSIEAKLQVRLAERLPPPFAVPNGRAIVLENQAQFDPQAYVRGLAREAANRGSRIFDRSAVIDVDSEQRVVRTAHGNVTAGEIVLATHSPVGIHAVQAEMTVHREYGLATRIDRASFPPGIFWGKGNERLSLRSVDIDGKTFLVCVGEEHKIGHEEDTHLRLDSLEAAAHERFGETRPAFWWSAQNYSPADGLPYIGRDASDCFIATGFATDGLVYGSLAATIIADEVMRKDNVFAPTVKASRFTLIKGCKGIVEENVSVMKSLIKDYVTDRKTIPLSRLARGTGAMVEFGHKTLAAYRDHDGSILAVSPVCTHMGCRVHWNSAEASWDCPCHGSRFSPNGTVIEGPATEPLKQTPVRED